MGVEIRLAEIEDERSAVYRMRYELYVEQQGLFRDTADYERRFLCDEDDIHSHILLAEIDGKLAGTLRITGCEIVPFTADHRKTYGIDRLREVVAEDRMFVVTQMLVRPELRGTTLEPQCMAKAVELIAQWNGQLLVANCQAHLLNHYMKIGFRPYGQLYNHPQNGVLVPIALILGDLEHLRQLRSPLLEPLEKAQMQLPESELERICSVVCEDVAVRSKLDLSTGSYLSNVAQALDDEDGLCGLMPDLTPKQARALIDLSHLMECQPGDAIILMGQVTRIIYLLLSGSLEIRRDGELIVELERRGTIVGEVAFFTSGGRMSDVYAGSRGARVLAFSDGTLRELMQNNGPLAAKFLYYVAQDLCQKLRIEAEAHWH